MSRWVDPRGAERQRNAVKEKGRGERAEQEILHSRFVRPGGIAPVAGQDVRRDGAHLEPDEGGEEFLRPGHDAHAGSGQQNQRAEFTGIEILALEITGGAEDHEKGHSTNNPVNEQTERIGPKKAGVCGARIHRGESRCGKRDSRAEQRNRRENSMPRARHDRSEQHHEHGERAQHDFRRDPVQVLERKGHLSRFHRAGRAGGRC